MGLGNLTDRSTGQTITQEFFNDIHSALNGSFVGRNSSGAPTSGQDLGTAAIPWGTIRSTALIINGEAVDTSQISRRQNVVISCKTRTTSNQPAFITPTGSAASFTIYGSTTNLVLDVNGTAVTVSTDIAKTGLTTAPAANNTCLLDDSTAAGQADTRLWGEEQHRKVLTVDTMGSNISALVGKFATFKVGTEYFIGLVESSTSISHCRRGYFYNSSLAPLNRVVLTNNDTITLMSTGWVFVDDDGTTVDVSYNNPVWSFTSPGSPATGDYWYDLDNELWKRYDGASFQIINRAFVGIVVIDSTNCVAARCADTFSNYSDYNSLHLEVYSTEIVRANGLNQSVHVKSSKKYFENSLPTWNITTDLAISADMYSATEQASTMYYLYVTDEGDTMISDIEPYYESGKFAPYHPHNPWRCVGLAYNDGSSNITKIFSFAKNSCRGLIVSSGNGFGSTNTKIRRFTTTYHDDDASFIYADSSTAGMSVTVKVPGKYFGSYTDGTNATSGNIGISLNSTQLTTDVTSVTISTLLCGTVTYYYVNTASFVTELKIGDVIRAHAEGVQTDYGHTGTTFKCKLIDVLI